MASRNLSDSSTVYQSRNVGLGLRSYKDCLREGTIHHQVPRCILRLPVGFEGQSDISVSLQEDRFRCSHNVHLRVFPEHKNLSRGRNGLRTGTTRSMCPHGNLLLLQRAFADMCLLRCFSKRTSYHEGSQHHVGMVSLPVPWVRILSPGKEISSTWRTCSRKTRSDSRCG